MADVTPFSRYASAGQGKKLLMMAPLLVFSDHSFFPQLLHLVVDFGSETRERNLLCL